MQTDVFEVLPPEPRPDLTDIVWLRTPEGLAWIEDQRPEGRPVPYGTEELRIINRRVSKFLNLPTPTTMFVPPGYKKLMRTPENQWSRDLVLKVRNGMDLWDMPYRHTAYMTDLNAYWHWYTEIRPGRFSFSWTLEDMLKDKSRGLYQVCRAIANERKAYRLRTRRSRDGKAA